MKSAPPQIAPPLMNRADAPAPGIKSSLVTPGERVDAPVTQQDQAKLYPRVSADHVLNIAKIIEPPGV